MDREAEDALIPAAAGEAFEAGKGDAGEEQEPEDGKRGGGGGDVGEAELSENFAELSRVRVCTGKSVKRVDGGQSRYRRRR